jgi:thioredoxin reductase (NADPH)
MVVRGGGLEASMSRYLIDRIGSLDNVTILLHSEVVKLEGDRSGGLACATVRDKKSGGLAELSVRHLFLFVGAEPNTQWLDGCVSLDQKGYILTGTMEPASQGGLSLPLQTSRPGVFAIGDVRSGSTKRVASAVGEGAAVVAQIHAMLGAASTTA